MCCSDCCRRPRRDRGLVGEFTGKDAERPADVVGTGLEVTGADCGRRVYPSKGRHTRHRPSRTFPSIVKGVFLPNNPTLCVGFPQVGHLPCLDRLLARFFLSGTMSLPAFNMLRSRFGDMEFPGRLMMTTVAEFDETKTTGPLQLYYNTLSLFCSLQIV